MSSSDLKTVVRNRRTLAAISAARRQEASRANTDENSVLQQKLTETTLMLEVLSEVNHLMSKGKTFEGFFIEVGKILKEKLKFKYIQIWIRDEKDQTLLRLVTPETVDGFRETTIFEGIIGKAVRKGITICLPDVARNPEYHNVHTDAKSELCVPLMVDKRVIGVLNIETDLTQSFTGKLPVIEVIAENLSHAVRLALLYRTEEHFQHLVENMTEGVWVGDANERTLYTNPAFQKIMGYSEQELLGKTSFDFFDEKDKKIIAQENEKRQHGLASHYEITLMAKNGEHIPVLIQGVPFGEQGTMSTITDLRPLRRTEQKLVLTERFLASVTRYCAEAIVGLAENDIVQSWNEGAERMFGFKPEEMIGKPLAPIIPEDRLTIGEPLQINQEARTKGFIRNFETIRLHKNGKPLLVSVTVSSVKDEHGKIIGYAALYRDITSQKKWERELQDRFEKMQDAYREMGRQRRQLDYLIDIINMALTSGHSKKQIATFIVNAILMVSKVDAATIRLLDRPTGKLILTAQSGLGEEWWTKKAIAYSGSLLERAVTHQSALKLLDIVSDPQYTSPALARKNNLRSGLVIPLEAKGEVLGSLSLYLTQEGNLSLLDDEFIAIFAKQASIALKLAE